MLIGPEEYCILEIRSRPYRDSDFDAARRLLQETYKLSGVLHNWSLRRWDGWHYHRADLSEKDTSCFVVWENENDEMIGLLHPEYEGSAFIEIHPAYRHIEEEMIIAAEECLPVNLNGGFERRLHFWVYETDIERQKLLENRNYDASPNFGYKRYRKLAKTIAQVSLAEGYQIRPMCFDADDCEKMANLLNAAFGRSFHSGKEYANFQTAPCYRPELDLVVVAPDGTFAATAGVTIDELNNYAEFEPVCTHPEHQRKGLARAVMAAGLRNLRRLGIKKVYVGAGDNPPANALYVHMGFTSAEKVRLWQKIWRNE